LFNLSEAAGDDHIAMIALRDVDAQINLWTICTVKDEEPIFANPSQESPDIVNRLTDTSNLTKLFEVSSKGSV
jgi:hypothetical protein